MSYTCISCQVLFANSDLQREHHKSDWHRYNLKRKVVQLPPVSAESFKNRILNQKAQEILTDDTKLCNTCHKSFNSNNTYDNHLKSKKHLENVKKAQENSVKKNKKPVKSNKSASLVAGTKPRSDSVSIECDELFEDDGSDWSSCDEDEDMETEESDQVPNIDTTVCLFCDTKSEGLDKNVDHMAMKHSFFIPDVEYLVDMPGLIEYLGWKVGVGKVCLWCNSKKATFSYEKGVKQHMVDKGHCKFAMEGDKVLEFSDFYDYSSSYPDAEEDQDESEAEVDIPQLEGDDWQLVLPSGTVIGHRSLKVYYNQNIPEKRICQRPVNRIVSQYRALGWTGSTGEAAIKKARDIRFMEKVRSKQMLKTGIKHNRLKQKHFRSQVPI